MKVGDLDKNEKFRYNGHIWTRGRKLPTRHFDSEIISCMRDDMRHVPFKANVEVEPLQNRLEV